jgi:DNA-binding transcriptional ArsR family regulator
VKDVFYVRTTAHWKALSHPLRVAVLKMLIEKPMTNERLAVALRQESGKLYFHTRQLLEAGMIEIAETRMRGTIAEKVYTAVAHTYVATGLPESAADGATVEGGSFTARMTPDRARAFTERLEALVAEFQIEGQEAADGADYSLRCLMHAVPNGAEPRLVLSGGMEKAAI